MHIVKKQIQNRSQIKKISLKNTVRGCPQKRTTLNVALFSAYSELKSNIKHEYHNYMHLKFHYLLTFICMAFFFDRKNLFFHRKILFFYRLIFPQNRNNFFSIELYIPYKINFHRTFFSIELYLSLKEFFQIPKSLYQNVPHPILISKRIFSRVLNGSEPLKFTSQK